LFGCFPNLGVQVVKGEEKERKKKSTWETRVFLGLNPPCWLYSGSQLLGAIKEWFVIQSLNIFLHLV
jgi:hypothetical protein